MQNYAPSTVECTSVAQLLETSCIKTAFQHINQMRTELDDELVRVCEIPAPPFKEEARAQDIARRFEEVGLSQIRTDEEGNVIAFRPGRSAEPRLTVSAHLDTVFPEGTDVRVRREGDRFHAPGISDNSCGIVSLVALVQALNAGSIETAGSICFVATVGEEGEGNLRGVRHPFASDEFRSGV